MTEEEIKALQVAKEETEVKLAEALEAARVATENATKSKGDVDKIVAELTEERRKKQEALDKANLTNREPMNVNEAIAQAFREREDQTRKADLESVMAEFKASKPEFQADAAGLVYSKFEQGLKQFTFADVTNKEQMKARLENAYRFLSPTQDAGAEPDYSGNAPSYSPVSSADPAQSINERKVLEDTGMDPAKYKALKAKYGEAFYNLGL